MAWVCPSHPQNEDPRIKFYLALFEEKVSVLPSSGQQGLCLMHAIMSGADTPLSCNHVRGGYATFIQKVKIFLKSIKP